MTTVVNFLKHFMDRSTVINVCGVPVHSEIENNGFGC